WATILFSNTLGTALGDFLAGTEGGGFGGGALIFGFLIVIIAAIYLVAANVPYLLRRQSPSHRRSFSGSAMAGNMVFRPMPPRALSATRGLMPTSTIGGMSPPALVFRWATTH
ncbi:MAG: hypothetical protein WCD42_07365, partial [Rhizomicrobium sp.]